MRLPPTNPVQTPEVSTLPLVKIVKYLLTTILSQFFIVNSSELVKITSYIKLI
jgi:hypothetical protein